jgi:phosphatidylglycerophosphatase A
MNRFSEILATFFYLGKVPWAPGTFGSLGGLLLFVGVAGKPLVGVFLFVFILLGGIFAAGRVEKICGTKDPKCVVVDEVAGMFIVYFMIPIKIELFLLGFVLYRVLDIIKPFGARQLERLPGGWGIMGDDVLCGIYANLILQVLVYFGIFM